jgi:hypothetical protein
MPFFEGGTSLAELARHLKQSLGHELEVELSHAVGDKLVAFTVHHLTQHRPVVLGLHWQTGAHWVLAVGVEYTTSKDYEAQIPRAFLVLDPGARKPSVSAWNNIVEAQPTRGQRKYRYSWWDGGVDYVALRDGLALWRS